MVSLFILKEIFEVLEGNKELILELYEVIRQDERHKNIIPYLKNRSMGNHLILLMVILFPPIPKIEN